VQDKINRATNSPCEPIDIKTARELAREKIYVGKITTKFSDKIG